MSWRETTLTILNAATESGVLDLAQFGARRKKDIGFIIPAHGQTVKVHFAQTTAGPFAPLNDGFGNDYVLTASTSQVLYGIPFGAMKLVAGAAVSGNQVFTIQAISVTAVER
jgi:hypothetical protein